MHKANDMSEQRSLVALERHGIGAPSRMLEMVRIKHPDGKPAGHPELPELPKLSTYEYILLGITGRDRSEVRHVQHSQRIQQVQHLRGVQRLQRSRVGSEWLRNNSFACIPLSYLAECASRGGYSGAKPF